MLITPSFKKSLLVEQFQGNYLKRRKKVFELQQFLSKRGIQYSDKRKEELIELCVNAQDLHMAQLETNEACKVAMENKLRTPKRDLPKPGSW